MIGFIIMIAVGVVVFTAWGWRNVISPYVIPLVGFLWRVLVIVMWFGMFIAIISTPEWYRLFGWNLTDFTSHIDQRHRMERLYDREVSYDLDGAYDPKWMQKAGRVPLPYNWDGHGEHLLPEWAPLVFIGVAYAFVRYRRRQNGQYSVPLEKKPKKAKPVEVVQETEPEEDDGPSFRQQVAAWHDQKNKQKIIKWDEDRELIGALKGLGYSGPQIKEVLPKNCSGPLWMRVKNALQHLT
jgi:hypothetical protein